MNDDTFHKLQLLDRYKKKARLLEEEEEERKKLLSSGLNTFISFSQLNEMASDGEKFFLPPTSKDQGCLSCGDGHLYVGTITEIREQLQARLKTDPENANTQDGLARINQELMAFPKIISSVLLKSPEEEEEEEKQTFITPTPFSIKPKIKK